MKNKKNTYEYWSSGNQFIGRVVKADYKEQEVEEYKNNPIIEALPAMMSLEEVTEKLARFPKYSEAERHLPDEIRLDLIENSREFYLPQPRHLELHTAISRMIRRSYVNRNPLDWGYWNHLEQKVEEVNTALNDENIENNHPSSRKKARGLTVIGIGGTGKSTSVEAILNLYPQVIEHSSYKGKDLILKQLVWVKLDAPQDGSIKGLCREFFLTVDEVAKTNYFKNYGSGTIDDMLINMARVSAMHSLGALVIDEIQDLSLAKSGGATHLMNFLVHLENKIGVPYILQGTQTALQLFQEQFRQARRACEQGVFPWEPLEMQIEAEDENGNTFIAPHPDWEEFVKTLWSYQYTKKPNLLADNILEDPLVRVLYHYSQGIPAVALSMYVWAQTRAITCGEEEMTVAIFKAVSKERQFLVEKGIEKLRIGVETDIDAQSDLAASKYKRRAEIRAALIGDGESESSLKSSLSKADEQKAEQKIPANEPTPKDRKKRVKKSKYIQISDEDLSVGDEFL